VEVIGLTTIFGNVTTAMATANALHLCEMAGRADVPVAQARPRLAHAPAGPAARAELAKGQS
jgi:inosine-uridine nucleoside N-ribohydrolase